MSQYQFLSRDTVTFVVYITTQTVLSLRRYAFRNFVYRKFHNEQNTLDLSFESEQRYSKSLPNKNEHVRTKTKTKEGSVLRK